MSVEQIEPSERVLVIDDLRSFVDDKHATYARTSQEGVEALQFAYRNEWEIDELWLDHDLGWDDTILPVVLWLAEMAESGTPLTIDTVYVHTGNPSAATQMQQRLEKYYDVQRVSAIKHSLLVEDDWA